MVSCDTEVSLKRLEIQIKREFYSKSWQALFFTSLLLTCKHLASPFVLVHRRLPDNC